VTEAIAAQVGGAVPTSPWELVAHATTFSKAVLAILALLSVASWAIMLAKWRELRHTERAGEEFMDEFVRARSLEEAKIAVRHTGQGPFARVFARAMDFMGAMRSAPAPAVRGGAGAMSGSQVEALRLVLDTEVTGERNRLGRFIPTLAVIASVSPLLGLLGTVVGVIDAFLGIATKGSGNIGAVAPGVAEALVATAVALSVAIPAVFGYNLLASRVNRLENELDAFGTEMIALLVREGQI
jgi:biopolymer transport protein TolQ